MIIEKTIKSGSYSLSYYESTREVLGKNKYKVFGTCRNMSKSKKGKIVFDFIFKNISHMEQHFNQYVKVNSVV